MRRPEAGNSVRKAAQFLLAKRVPHRRRLAPTVAIFCAAYLGPAQAARWSIDSGFETRATWSDNVSFDQRGATQSDTIFELIPSVTLRGEGKRLRVAGTISVDALTYANGTRDSRALPGIDLTANLEAIERFFFIEAGVITRQGAEDVFAARPDGGSDFNTVTITQYRLAPMFEGRLGSDVQYRLRSSNSWTVASGAATTDTEGAYLGQHVLRIERRPGPFGWSIEGGREETRFESSTPPTAIIDSGRISLVYAFTPTFNMGLRGGYESTNIVVENGEQVIYGVEMAWRPSERTDLNGFWEERFFGAGWRLNFNHRMPRLAWTLTFSRNVESLPESFLTLPPTNNVAALLDAAFTTRFPDPAERSRVVSDVIARQGLPSSLGTQTNLITQRVSLVRSGNVGVAYLGVRNSIALDAFVRRTEDITDSIFAAPAGSVSNVAQEGVSLTFTHQLTPSASLNLTTGYSQSRGIGPDEGAKSKQDTVRVQLTRQMAPKTQAFVGARWLKFDSNVDVLVPGATQSTHETAVFAGLGHRF